MTKPLFCILGASASGKSTLVKMLENEFKMKQIPSYTTRSPRFKGEEGHTFVSEKEFKALNDIVAYNYYLGNHYGVTASQIDDDTYNLYVVDQTGLNELRKKYRGNRKIYSIFIDCLRLLGMIACLDVIIKCIRILIKHLKKLENVLSKTR